MSLRSHICRRLVPARLDQRSVVLQGRLHLVRIDSQGRVHVPAWRGQAGLEVAVRERIHPSERRVPRGETGRLPADGLDELVDWGGGDEREDCVVPREGEVDLGLGTFDLVVYKVVRLCG